MKIIKERKKYRIKREKQFVKEGDLIKIGDDICLVIKQYGELKNSESNFAIITIGYENGIDVMMLNETNQEKFERGEYEIYAEKNRWAISVGGDWNIAITD